MAAMYMDIPRKATWIIGAKSLKGTPKGTAYCREKGWHTKRVWEHEFKKDNFDFAIDEIANFIQINKGIKKENK